jgi:phosphocarrier protein
MAQNPHISRRQVVISNVLGLHLRAADKFVRLAATYQSEIKVQCKGIVANGKSIISLLSLAAECGTELSLEAHGCDAQAAVVALSDLVSGQSLLQHGDAESWSPKADPTNPCFPVNRISDLPRRLGSARVWDLGRRAGQEPGIDRRVSIRGRWARR